MNFCSRFLQLLMLEKIINYLHYGDNQCKILFKLTKIPEKHQLHEGIKEILCPLLNVYYSTTN